MDPITTVLKYSRNFMSVESALVRLLSSFKVPKINAKRAEYVYLIDSNRRVLAENLYSSINVPPFDRVDRDGFAISSFDTRDASHHSPIYLNIIGKVLAGIGRHFGA